MKKTDLKKQLWIESMAAHVLQHGLNATGLRALAKAADTSDRMLIYHFKSKNELIKQLLAHLFDDLAERVSNALPQKHATSRAQCIQDMLQALKSTEYKPYMRVWLEVVAHSAKEDELYKGIAQQMTGDFLAWIIKYLPEDEPEPERAAKAILVLLEGENVMNSVGYADIGLDAIHFLLGNE